MYYITPGHYILGILFWGFMCAIWGIGVRNLAYRRGYRGYFWTGFFFGLIGMVYVGFLPVRSRNYYNDNFGNQTVNNYCQR